ncbi:hypothetical protein A8U91_03032 [Halomonas elongata]|uniref:Uncharacterized protein n=1 Tax=Halomonas elongata TaxID=2746 RepID=A0A1B8NVI6_HALEL|nr:hypothetical protein A8U91_03032 [Halomonas elongata]
MSLLVQSSPRLGRVETEDAVVPPRGTRRLAWGGFSVLLDRRTLAANLLLLLLVLAASLAYLCFGERTLSPAEVLAVLNGTGMVCRPFWSRRCACRVSGRRSPLARPSPWRAA